MNFLVRSNFQLTKRFFSLSNVRTAVEGRIGYPNERYEPTTIAALDKEGDKRLPLITGLYENGFMIGGSDRIIGAVFAFPRQIICWNVKQSKMRRKKQNVFLFF